MDGRKLKRVSSPSILLLAIIGFASQIGISLAWAHTVMISSNPAINSKVRNLPQTIELTFADQLLQIKDHVLNVLSVTDPMNQEDVIGPTLVKGARITAKIHSAMQMDGSYKVKFRVVAQDGHVVQGSFEFFVSAQLTSTPSSKNFSDKQKGIFRLKVTSDKSLAPKGKSNASFTGQLTVDLAQNQLCYIFNANFLTAVTAIHLHPFMQSTSKSLTISDEVFVSLQTQSINASKYLCTKVANSSLNLIVNNPSHYAIMIHTRTFTDGAAAGKLSPE